MKIYNYNNQTREFLSEEEAQRDPLEKEERYLIPASATTIEPIEVGENEVAVFESDKWVKKIDLRGKKYWNKQTKEEFVINEIGDELGSEYTDKELPSKEEYIVWDGNDWVIDEAIKQNLLEETKSNSAVSYLRQTDWYVIRKLETDVEIPLDVQQQREQARQTIVEKQKL